SVPRMPSGTHRSGGPPASVSTSRTAPAPNRVLNSVTSVLTQVYDSPAYTPARKSYARNWSYSTWVAANTLHGQFGKRISSRMLRNAWFWFVLPSWRVRLYRRSAWNRLSSTRRSALSPSRRLSTSALPRPPFIPNSNPPVHRFGGGGGGSEPSGIRVG